MDELNKSRQKINEIDKQMAELFEERMNAVVQIGKYKQEHQMPILDSSREQEVIEKNTALLHDQQLKPYFDTVLKSMMQVSRTYQRQMMHKGKVVYAGVAGAFSHIAAKQLFPSDALQQVSTFQEAFLAVINHEAEFGVVPFENSYTGEVGEILDYLYQYDLHIYDVYDLKIEQNLLGLPNASLSDIKEVYSHPQAISQSKEYLDMHPWVVIPYSNTAMAAQYISQANDLGKGAIASEETASLYNLKILQKHINTSNDNTTRFIVISNQMREHGNRFHILFTLRHNSGQLAKVMQIIAEYGFNMESIKSRPLRHQPWQYYFYVVMDGNMEDEKTKEMLKKLAVQCEKLKLLGAFDVQKG